ncbi:MAG: c-type cytochrome, partial [Myxococcota bacterium]
MIAPVGPLGIAALLGLAALGLVLDEPALAADPANGELLAGLAGCGACHTADGGAPYAGGGPIETRFGTFRATNLTPDPEHGLGGWTERDFARAMRDGRAPDGHAYWPVFPYPAFSGLTDADLADLWAYLRTIPPSATPNVASEPDAGR